MKKYKLGDIADIIGGVTYDKKDIVSEGIRILRGGNIQNNTIILKNDDVFLPDSYYNISNALKEFDTVIVASTGSVDVLGKSATVFSPLNNIQIGAFLRIIRPKKKEYASLIAYYLRSRYFRNYIQKQAKGTSINNIRNEYLENFYLHLPDDSMTENFSTLYKNIEKKLNLNRAINHNLVAMAKQLYDYWFVQFDFPNRDGKPYKSSGGKMVWNEKLKREIPEGWEVKELNEIIKVKDGTHTSPKPQNEGYYLITSKHISENGIDFNSAYRISIEDYTEINRRSLVESRDILFSMIGTIGQKYLVTERTINYAIKNMALLKTSQYTEIVYYIWLYLSSIDYIRYESNVISGSIQKFMSLDAMRKIPILYNLEKILSFQKIVTNLFLQISITNSENKILTKQRDELLPLLMNGQVTVG